MNIFNDGAKPTGSSILVVKKGDGAGALTAVGTYATDDFSKSVPTSVEEYTNDDNVPSGALITRGVETGSATLQFASGSAVRPEVGHVFRHPVDASGNVWYVITEAGVTESKGGESKIPVSFRQVINTAVLIDNISYTLPA
jgi:hypothetical protein